MNLTKPNTIHWTGRTALIRVRGKELNSSAGTKKPWPESSGQGLDQEIAGGWLRINVTGFIGHLRFVARSCRIIFVSWTPTSGPAANGKIDHQQGHHQD